MTLDELKQQIVEAQKRCALALSETQKAGQARLVIFKQMELEKKNALARLKQQRAELLRLLQLMNKQDLLKKKYESQVGELQETYKQLAAQQAEKAIAG